MRVPGVTIENGPMDWQIIQRDKTGFGSLAVSGTYETLEKHFSVEARLVHENNGLPVAVSLDWRPARLSGRTFSMRLARIPAGGLYRLETRIRRPFARDKRPLRGDCVHHLGVGDIYVIAGQSNASGTGKGIIDDGPELGIHLFANDERWKLAVHPLENATATRHPATVTGVFHGHSPWLHFARGIRRHTGLPVGLIPTAAGGSPLHMWIPRRKYSTAAPLLANMFAMIAKAGGAYAGILWYQGESDVDPDRRRTYAADFTRLVKTIRRRCGNPRLPVLTAQLNRKLLPDSMARSDREACDRGWTAMRQLQREVRNQVKDVCLVTTLDAPLSDEIHLSAAGNLIVGERFAWMALEKIYGHKLCATHPEPERARFLNSARSAIEVFFRNLSGDFITICRIDGFSVEDRRGRIGLAAVTVTAKNRMIVRLNRPAEGTTVLHGAYGCDPVMTLRDDSGRCVMGFSEEVK